MPNIEGGTAAQQARVRNEIANVLARLPRQIISVPLEKCIKKMALGDDTIYIGGDECLLSDIFGFTTWYVSLGVFKIKSSDVHLCLSNIDRLRTDASATLMHEWAHTCCWDHGDGKGVPSGGKY
jgi:hypothetical protein